MQRWWEVVTDTRHSIVAEASPISGRETVWLDGRIVVDEHSMNVRNEYGVDVGSNQTVRVVTRLAWYGLPVVELWIGSQRIEPSEAAAAVEKVKGPADIRVLFLILAYSAAGAALFVALDLGLHALGLQLFPGFAGIGAGIGAAFGLWHGIQERSKSR